MDLFEMLRCLNQMTNCFFGIAKVVKPNYHIINLFVEARDRASELLSQEAKKEEKNGLDNENS